jgi:hypothetical protein
MKQKLLLFLLLLTSLATYAYDFESNGIYYTITSDDDKTVEVTTGDTDYSGDVVIPETVTYSDAKYSVNSIIEYAFYGCISLMSVELPASMTSIGDRAFLDCTSLKTVSSYNPKPPTLGSDVFANCPIETVYVPVGSVETYQAAYGWKELNIVGIGTSGVEDAIFGGDVFGGVAVESATVYTLQGVRVKGVRTMDDVKSLTPGLYIVNGKKVFVK